MVDSAKKTARWEKWAAADESYVAQAARLKQLLERAQIDATNATVNRNRDYAEAMRQLGYVPGVDGAAGTWDVINKQRGIGQAQDALRNNFADRGMTRSSGAVTAGTQLATKYTDEQARLKQQNTTAEEQQVLDMQRAAQDAEQQRLEARNAAVKRRQAGLTSGLY